MCLDVVAILLLNVMEVFSVCGGALLARPYILVFQRACVVPVNPGCISMLLLNVLFVFLYVGHYQPYPQAIRHDMAQTQYAFCL